MELIINPTSRCNFNCDFCSAKNTPFQDLTSHEVISYAKTIKAQDIIVNGGDPLCMPVEFYDDILSGLPNVTLSFTTNLKDFYLHPYKWVELFSNPRVNICTSFQLGDKRKYANNEPYTLETFYKVQNLFHSFFGYHPMFIAVIDKDNAHLWREHLGIAKTLNTKCRLNPSLPLGSSSDRYPIHKMFEIYTQIVDEHLDIYEQNTLERGLGRCPFNTSQLCQNHIRVLQKINNKLETYSCGNEALIQSTIQDNKPLTDNCYQCRLYRLCNSCRYSKSIIDNPQEHCLAMQKLLPKLVNQGWLL